MGAKIIFSNRTFYVPNLMQLSKTLSFRFFTLGSTKKSSTSETGLNEMHAPKQNDLRKHVELEEAQFFLT